MELQMNFTTPEQSKRLLELGVPANSADCYTIINNYVYNKDEIRVRQNEYEINYSFFNNKHYNPCWSVGRLIEIYLICNEVIDNVTELHHSAIKIDVREFNTVEYLISKLTNKVKKNKEFFSKLEE